MRLRECRTTASIIFAWHHHSAAVRVNNFLIKTTNLYEARSSVYMAKGALNFQFFILAMARLMDETPSSLVYDIFRKRLVEETGSYLPNLALCLGGDYFRKFLNENSTTEQTSPRTTALENLRLRNQSGILLASMHRRLTECRRI